MSRFLPRLANVFRMRRAEDELGREVQSHLMLLQEEVLQC